MSDNKQPILDLDENSFLWKTRLDAVEQLIRTIPTEGSREGTAETPKRVAKMYNEIFAGYSESPAEILSKTFATDVEGDDDADERDYDIYQNGIVAVSDIPFYSSCEHHMVPFFGKAHIAYIPRDRVVGLSKLARLTDCFAKRLQIQERLTRQIANAIEDNLDPLGVMVVIQAEHMCMAMRGIRKPGSLTTTSAVRGVFENDAAARAECLTILGLGGKK